jgi:hypothetical protein
MQGGLLAYATRDPRHAGLFTEDWRQALEREAEV